MGMGTSCSMGRRRSSFLAYASELIAADGIIYDIGDLSTLFADSEGKTPAVIDGPVGFVADKFGNAQHAVQVVESCRPTLRFDGHMHWLEFDGIDDHLVIASSSVASHDAGTVLCMGLRLLAPRPHSPILTGHGLSLATSPEVSSKTRWRTELSFADGSVEAANSASGCYPEAGKCYCRTDVDDNATFTTRINGVAEIQVRRDGEPWANSEMTLFRRGDHYARADFFGMVLVPSAIEESKLTRLESYVCQRMRLGEIK